MTQLYSGMLGLVIALVWAVVALGREDNCATWLEVLAILFGCHAYMDWLLVDFSTPH